MDLKAENADLKADNAALREQADVDRSFIEQYRHDRIDWEQAYYERDRAYARLAADNTALRERLEQWVAEAQDKANPQIRPMTRMENAWMDEQAKCGALEADNAALRERLEALERAAWGAVATIEDYEASDDWLDDRAKELRAALASQPEVTP
jgi:chromosome segregation ATPase